MEKALDHQQVSKWSSDDDHPSGSSQTRSYTCTFCKRGFSNAQALGGHMNIHRRDRARIRQQLSEENQLSSWEATAMKTTTLAADSDNVINNTPKIALEENKAIFDQLEQQSSELRQINHITKTSFSLHIKDNEEHIICTTLKDKIGMSSSTIEELQQLPLFAEEPPISEDKKVCVYGENVTEELDLELRLGLGSRRNISFTLSNTDFF